MTAGFECRDSYLYQWQGLRQMKRSKDWVQFMIDLPVTEEPGTFFEYCNGVSFLLSAILQEQTGENALSFAEKNLFGPLGITDVRWPSNPQGITIGYGQLQMRPRDMAKFGYLYLNNGVWDGHQIISSQWIKASIRKHIDATLLPGYGYQWWIVNPGIYTAIGYQGQFIMLVPKKKLLAVFTSSLAQEDFYTPLGLLASYIVPAAKSPTPLPENPDKANALKSYSTLLQTTSPVDRKKIKKDQLVPPVVFRRRGLKGLPVFAALVDDIPQGMALENTADYMIDLYKSTLKITDYKNNKIIGAIAGSTQETPIDYLAGMVKSLKFKK